MILKLLLAREQRNRILKIEQWRNEPKGPLNSEYSDELYEEQELNSSKEYKMSARNE